MRSAQDREFFIPAATTVEAISRIYALTGATPANRGEKRALVALRDALGLDVDVARTNAVLGEHLAQALDAEWIPERHTVLNKVNLAGLNLLLEAATEAYQEGSLQRVAAAAPRSLEGAEWAAFRPAVSKIEAVTRIAALTRSPAEWLGPGSKEHKSVLTNLADRLLPGTSLDRSSKTRLGRDIAAELGMVWTDTSYSTGETISLEGLNIILAGAERRVGRLGISAADLLAGPAEEGEALVAALYDGWPAQALGWTRVDQVVGEERGAGGERERVAGVVLRGPRSRDLERGVSTIGHSASSPVREHHVRLRPQLRLGPQGAHGETELLVRPHDEVNARRGHPQRRASDPGLRGRAGSRVSDLERRRTDG